MDEAREAQDSPTTTIFSEEEQAPEAWYSWQFTPAPGDPTQLFEFGMPLAELSAANKIAKYLGVDTLPDGYTLVHPEISPLETRMMERDAKGEGGMLEPQKVAVTEPSTPEPVVDDTPQIHDPDA